MEVTYRKFKSIDNHALQADLRECLNGVRYDTLNVEGLLVLYERTLREVLGRHAPERTAVIAQMARAPWYTEDIAEAKQKRLLWRSNGRRRA